MLKLSLRRKILLAALVPVLVASCAITFQVFNKFHALGQSELETLRNSMLESKRQSLKNYTSIARSAIQPELDKLNGPADEADKARIAEILRAMTFEGDGSGYIFAYDYSGVNIATRIKRSLEGKNLMQLQDKNGVYLIRELINRAREGGGYVEYLWPKASKNADLPKLSYAVAIPELNWMMGTGFHIDDIDDAVLAEQHHVEAEINETITLVVIEALLIAAVFALAIFWMATRISNPLKQTARAMQAIGKGEGDLSQRLPIQSNDEVGAVASGFNDFAEKIQHTVLSLQSSTHELSTAIDKIRHSISDTSEHLEVQRQESAMAAQTISELTQTTSVVLDNAGQAAKAAQVADQESGDGRDVVATTMTAISGLSDEVNQASTVIGELDSNVDDISKVIKVISEIADQTNLLALNAAIESARAGELGRGFSVVADEVRTLANRTQQSTEEIQAMIAKLQTGARQAVVVMERSRTQSEQTVTDAGRAKQSLEVIADSVSTITQMNQKIASAVDQQTCSAIQINNNVQQVSTMAQRSAQSAQELSLAAQELEDLQANLQRVVGQFKV